MVGLQLFQRIAVHGHRGVMTPRRRREVREFGGDEIAVARMAAQRHAGGMLRFPLAICGRRIEIVHPVFQSLVHEAVHHILVNLLLPVAGTAAGNGGPAHASVAEQRHLLARLGIGAVCHSVGGNLTGSSAFGGNLLACRGTAGQGKRGHGGPQAEPFYERAAAQTAAFVVIGLFHRQIILWVSCPST